MCTQLKRCALWACVMLIAAVCSPSAGAGSGSGGGFEIQRGQAQAGGRAMRDATIRLYCAGDVRRQGATLLAETQTNRRGNFQLHYQAPDDADAVLYLIAEGPLGHVKLASVLGFDGRPKNAKINERTTIATVWTMAQFIDGEIIGGNEVGVRNASLTFRNLVNPKNGRIAPFLKKKPNGLQTSTLRKVNSLSNMLAACARLPYLCPVLFSFATPEGGATPENTLQAAINIAHHPGNNFAELWLISKSVRLCKPDMQVPPPDWTLAIKYVGNGKQFSGPGASAIDENGIVWVNNNYTPRRNRFLRSCGSHLLTKFSPDGRNIDGSPFTGGGLDGAGFGITLDPFGDVWVGNFGFYGSTCPEPLQPAANSVSKFMPDGTAESPPIIGFTQGNILGPQATVSDQMGNIWLANACNGTVTQYRGGNPDNNWNVTIEPGMCSRGEQAKPFGIAIDHMGNGWVTDNSNYAVYQLDTDGNVITGPICGEETGIYAPMGISIDSLGHIWISNSGIVRVPCGDLELGFPDYGSLIPDPANASATLLAPDGTFMGVYTGAGIFIPWGNCIDGEDHLWIANFGGQRVSKICGANPETWPAGKTTGDALSPENGYQFNGLVRNTGVSIDPSGNVWLANNWLTVPVLTNPGGDGMVVFIGLAAPVQTPLIGPVKAPGSE